MAKGMVVRGTPVTFKSDGNAGSGRAAGIPPGYDGTVLGQFGNDQEGMNGKTPYTSKDGNPADARRVVSSSRHGGVVLSENGINHNDPRANGNGIAFDGISYAKDYTPYSADVMDSPVPKGAQQPLVDASVKTNAIRNGVGTYFGADQATPDSFQEMGGVMSRGMAGTSTPGGGEKELLEDDTLKNMGPGGAEK